MNPQIHKSSHQSARTCPKCRALHGPEESCDPAVRLEKVFRNMNERRKARHGSSQRSAVSVQQKTGTETRQPMADS